MNFFYELALLLGFMVGVFAVDGFLSIRTDPCPHCGGPRIQTADGAPFCESGCAR